MRKGIGMNSDLWLHIGFYIGLFVIYIDILLSKTSSDDKMVAIVIMTIVVSIFPMMISVVLIYILAKMLVHKFKT